MFKNYFKTAFRNFWRNRTFSLINIAGLAIGISASLVIYLIVSFDFNFDKFEKDNDRIYRVVANYNFSGELYKSSGAPYPMGRILQKEVTGIEEVAAFRIWQGGYRGIKVSVPSSVQGNATVFRKQDHIIFADSGYFGLIQYKWLAGSAKTSLLQPYQIVLTQSNANLYFPNIPATEIIGREMYFNDDIRTVVSGIVEDIKANTDFTFKMFMSSATMQSGRLRPDSWDSWSSTDPISQLCVKLSPGVDVANINTQLAKIAAKYQSPAASRGVLTSYHLQPLSDIHFNTDYDSFNQRLAHKPTLYGLLAVAAFLLLLACINFINLTTAQASRRAKEIGVRKTMGSSKKQLMLQFLSETFLLTLTATIISLGLAPLLLNMFSAFIPAGLHFNPIAQPGILLFLAVLIISVCLLSGFYPALVLSSFKPVLVLKGYAMLAGGRSRSAWLRKTLTVTQFVIAQVFVIASVLVAKQINYSLTADMGFKKEGIIYFDTNYSSDLANQKFILRDKLKALPGVAMVSLSNTPASYSGGMRGGTMKYNDGTKEQETHVNIKLADSAYIGLYKMKLLAGTNLPNSDTVKAMLINETYARTLGFKTPQDAVGKSINWNDWGIGNVPVVGVVQDFNMRSFHEPIKPLVIASRVSEHLTVNVALQPQSADGTAWRNTITQIQKTFKELYPEDVLDLHFMDETVAKYYEAEENISKLLVWATCLSIFISCLGLLGLVIYITNQRTKEIGIRKVIGATVGQLVALLSKDFLQLVIVAFLIAVPIAWWGSYNWLQSFAYKTTLSWWIFATGGITTLLIAFIILATRTVRAAKANPVEALRME